MRGLFKIVVEDLVRLLPEGYLLAGEEPFVGHGGLITSSVQVRKGLI